MVNFVVCQDFGLEFLAKAKHLRPRTGPQSQDQGQPAARPRPQNLALGPRRRTNITAGGVRFGYIVCNHCYLFACFKF